MSSRPPAPLVSLLLAFDIPSRGKKTVMKKEGREERRGCSLTGEPEVEPLPPRRTFPRFRPLALTRAIITMSDLITQTISMRRAAP